MANERDATLTRVDIESREVQTIGGVEEVAFLTRDNRGNIYASAWDHPFVWRIDPRSAESRGALSREDAGARAGRRRRLVVGHRPAGERRCAHRPRMEAFRTSSRWAPTRCCRVRLRLAVGRQLRRRHRVRDPAGVRRVDTIEGIYRSFGIAAGEGAIWVASNSGSSVTKIDPDTRRKIAEIDLTADGAVPVDLYGVAVGAGSVWALDLRRAYRRSHRSPQERGRGAHRGSEPRPSRAPCTLSATPCGCRSERRATTARSGSAPAPRRASRP